MNWPYEVSFAQTLQIPVSVLYFICLFYCFVNWTPEAPIFRLVWFMPRFRHKIKYKISKTRKTDIEKKIKTKRKIQGSSFIRCAFVFFFFKTIIVLTSFFFSPLSWGQLKLKAEECEKRIYCYSVILFLVIKIWKANVEILYSLVLASLNGKQPVDIYWA